MIWILFGVCMIASIFGIHLFRIKRQLHDITIQLEERTSENTGKKVTIALIDDDLCKLAAAINRNLDLQKELRIDVLHNDLQLKDSIANLSHDLRTPLTSILGYLQLSQSTECSAEKQNEYLKTVDDKAHVLKFMINNLYELSVLDIKETPLKEENIDLNLLLCDLLAGQYEMFRKLEIILNVNLPDHPVWISGDQVACTRIIQNLLSNSSHYANGNTSISLSVSDSYAFLSISNPAPNLTEEDTRHLFERFYTADKSRNSSGSGLGLYIVKTLLTKMNGKIADVSLEEHILCIKVGFPLSR